MKATKFIDGVSTKCTGAMCDSTSDQGLDAPAGLALHQAGSTYTLYVSDLTAENIYKYPVSVILDAATNSYFLSVGGQERVATGIPGGAHSLACDGLGNLFYTSSTAGQVEMIPVEKLQSGDTTSQARKVLYAPDPAVDPNYVSKPGGIAVDNYFVYWTNTDAGETKGTIVKAYENPQTAEAGTFPAPIAGNAAMAKGICLARGTVFYSGDTTSLFATKLSGGVIAEVSGAFQKPRGCAYDLMGSLYVADEQANAIYSLPGNMPQLRSVKHLSKVISVNQPNQIVILSSAWRCSLPTSLFFLLVGVVLGSVECA